MIQDTLDERGQSYGEYKDGAQIAMDLFEIVQEAPSYRKMNAGQRYAMFMFTAKMARLLNGDPNHKDSWTDIIGYATLVLDRIAEKPDAEGWIAWTGGECPLKPDASVALRLRSGSYVEIMPAKDVARWQHIDSVSDIIAYRPS